MERSRRAATVVRAARAGLQTALDKRNVRAPMCWPVVIRRLAVLGSPWYPRPWPAWVLRTPSTRINRSSGGQPHVLREEVKGRAFENPRIQLNTEMLNRARETAGRTPAGAIASPLDRLPAAALTLWSWAQSQPLLELARSAEADWSPEELVRMHQDRLRDRASLGDLPLIVLARTAGGFSDGMSIPADVLERNRRAFQADLAALSRAGRLVFAARSGHNIHVEDPDLVVRSILELVTTVRARPSSESQLRRSGS